MAKVDDTEIGGKEYGAARIRTYGNTQLARTYLGQARYMLGDMKRFMQLSEIGDHSRNHRFSNGAIIQTKSIFGIDGFGDTDEIIIDVSGVIPQRREAQIISFEAYCSTWQENGESVLTLTTDQTPNDLVYTGNSNKWYIYEPYNTSGAMLVAGGNEGIFSNVKGANILMSYYNFQTSSSPYFTDYPPGRAYQDLFYNVGFESTYFIDLYSDRTNYGLYGISEIVYTDQFIGRYSRENKFMLKYAVTPFKEFDGHVSQSSYPVYYQGDGAGGFNHNDYNALSIFDGGFSVPKLEDNPYKSFGPNGGVKNFIPGYYLLTMGGAANSALYAPVQESYVARLVFTFNDGTVITYDIDFKCPMLDWIAHDGDPNFTTWTPSNNVLGVDIVSGIGKYYTLDLVQNPLAWDIADKEPGAPGVSFPQTYFGNFVEDFADKKTSGFNVYEDYDRLVNGGLSSGNNNNDTFVR